VTDFRLNQPATLVGAAGGVASVALTSPAKMHWEEWPGTPLSITSSAYAVAWQTPVLATQGTFYQAIWQVNSDGLLLRVDIDGVKMIDGLLLKDLEKKFKLKNEEGSLPSFSIAEYESKRWAFNPPVPVGINSGSRMTVSFQAVSGTKKIERGISVWGEV